MRRVVLVCSLLAASVLMTGSALAAPATASAPTSSGDKCTKDKNGVMRCEFGGDKVWGAVVGPKGRFIGGKTPVIFKSLIDYRVDFLPELNRTVEEL